MVSSRLPVDWPASPFTTSITMLVKMLKANSAPMASTNTRSHPRTRSGTPGAAPFGSLRITSHRASGPST